MCYKNKTNPSCWVKQRVMTDEIEDVTGNISKESQVRITPKPPLPKITFRPHKGDQIEAFVDNAWWRADVKG